MATLSNSNSFNVTDYPTEEHLEEARGTLKPPGILSNNYNKQGLKKVERTFVPSKTTSGLRESNNFMHQTNYQPSIPSDEKQSTTYFDITTKHNSTSAYDRVHHMTEGYNQKLHRDDRLHAKQHGLSLHKEESQRRVPVTSNAQYGAPNRLLLESHSKEHGHIEICKQDFNRRCGINFK
ncbi:cilia- and flagella-associated protein 90-like [Clytia hemisphaerica]|uniref:Uncharacterized protein n=1 Tax=Clytia hemisphaerica TaxID=252671 RepID=A0A7M5XJQ7_9CNID|eukprot:TCONS_00008602-protein